MKIPCINITYEQTICLLERVNHEKQLTSYGRVHDEHITLEVCSVNKRNVSSYILLQTANYGLVIGWW